MKSTKILTLNPIPSGVNQKLVPAKKYNELWDDLHNLEDIVNNLPVPAGPSIVNAESLNFLIWTGMIGAQTLLQVIVKEKSVVTLQPVVGGNAANMAFISAAEVISSILYNGTGTLTYFMEDAGNYPPFIPSEDPKEAIIMFDCSLLGTQIITLIVTDGALTSEVQFSVIVQDNAGIC